MQDLKGSSNLRESSAIDRKFLSRIDWPVIDFVVSTPKGDQGFIPHAKFSKP